MSHSEQFVEKIMVLVQPIVEGAGLELVDVQYRQESAGWMLRVFIYDKDGISIDHCARISREVSHLLDVEDIIPYKYNLEVSSPGLDRPLVTERDFERNIGEKVTLVVDEEGKSKECVGHIKDVGDGKVTVLTESGQEMYPVDEIVKAKLVIEF
ncbi:MAG: ribosome maturation factor RimP [Desulfobulbaceae bacterium]|uniref:Ribosome maturation factor RimP n=1 Tax=Candidatus Desulfobia pelagia TaxID=2841692 RepID=A0A8J6NBV4_9BACT|nr:ribosome maturation factor RimP [Candidatus Desulfobia pelagia]